MKIFSQQRAIWFAVGILMLSMGAGCASVTGAPSNSSSTTSGKNKTELASLSPHERSQKINFVPGTVIEMRQTIFGVGAELAKALPNDKKEGVRQIVIDRFAPMQGVDLTWKLTTKTESKASIKARETAKAARKSIPDPVMTDVVRTGNLDGIDLQAAHELYLPAFWPEALHAPAFSRSGIWLSDEVFQGISRNRVGTLSFGVLSPELTMILGKTSALSSAIHALQGRASSIENRIDLMKVDGDKDVSTMSLVVNGQPVDVEVLKAHSWFGEMVILNNRQNPLILKMTLNPLVAVASEAFGGSDFLKSFVGYQITEVKDVPL